MLAGGRLLREVVREAEARLPEGDHPARPQLVARRVVDLQWLGHPSYSHFFYGYRDTMSVLNHLNGIADFNNEAWPFPKMSLGSLCNRLGVENLNPHDALGRRCGHRRAPPAACHEVQDLTGDVAVLGVVLAKVTGAELRDLSSLATAFHFSEIILEIAFSRAYGYNGFGDTG